MVRLARIGTGVVLILLGMPMLVLPGPGILTIAAGLAVLSSEFTWAQRLLDWMKKKFRGYFAGNAPTEPPELSLTESDH